MIANRLIFLDNLKVVLIILLILHHVGQGYGPTGGWWFYMSQDSEKLEWMGRFFAVNASFRMGLLFLISGFFFAPSYNKKGLKNYLIDKLIRYGIPLVFVYWLMMPFIFYFYYELYSGNPSLPFLEYFEKIYLGLGEKPGWFKATLIWPERFFGFGHLWFVENLLLYSLMYSILRFILKNTSFSNKFKLNVIVFSLAFCFTVSIASIIIRDHFAVGDFRSIYGFFMIEVAHWPNYLGFLIAGIVAQQTDLFQKFPSNYGKTLLGMGIILALKVYFPSLFPDKINNLAGEYFEVYETILGFSLSFGLITFFRDHMNKSVSLFTIMAQESYGAYIFHYPIVITLQFLFDKSNLNNFSKFFTVGLLSIIVAFAFSHLIRKSKIVRRII